MIYGVVWKFKPANGPALKLMAHPEGLTSENPEENIDSPEKAMDEGRKTLGDLQPYNKSALMPLSVVELNDEMIDRLGECPLYELDGEDELMFVDVGALDFWIGQPWWHQ